MRMVRLMLAVLVSLISISGGYPQDASANPDIAQIVQSGTNLPQLLEQPEIIAALANGETPAPVERERQRLHQLLISLGYLDAEIDLDIAKSSPSQAPAVTALVHSGTQYQIGQVHIDAATITDPAILSTLEDAALFANGQLAKSTVLDEIADRLIWQLGEAGYPFAAVDSLTTAPGSAAGLIDVIVLLAPGNAARFGGISYDRVPESLMNRVAAAQPFQPGALYSSAEFDAFRSALVGMPNVRRSRVDILPLSGGRFELVVRVRSSGVTSFDERSTAIGAAVLGATLVVILLSLLARGSNLLRTSHSALAMNIVIMVMAVVSVSFVAVRAASLV